MGSKRKGREGRVAFGALALILAVVAGCTSSGATPGDAGPLASGVHVSAPSIDSASGSAVPRTTTAAVTVDQITSNVTYKSELITPLAHLYGKFLDDFVIFTIQNANSTPVKVMTSSEIPNFTTKATDTVTVDAGGSAEIREDPPLTTAAIDNLNAAKQAEVHVVVSYLDNGEARTVLDQTAPMTVTSRRDFPWKIEGYETHAEHELIVTMVTPDDPAVAQLIRKAANYDSQHAMGAGAALTPERVLEQLADVWQAEDADYHLTYISTTESFASDSQRIRLPGEVLPEASGNCIELSLLYAAVAESLGFPSYLILVPGHAYMAVDVDDQGNSVVIETTMIGSNTFDEARQYGSTEWDKAAAEMAAGNAEYDVVGVSAARKKGITPIPWH